MSRIGIRPVIVPKEVKVDIKAKTVTIEGPKGKLVRVLPDRISAEFKDGKILVSRVANTKIDKSLHGLHRALLVNMVKGVTEGYVKEMEIIGTGFRAAIQGNTLNMLLGFSHPV
ncbi:50S ribosomal protein L6, partial [bacterium]